MSNDFRVTLLGTGVPIPSPDRFGPSTLVEAGDQKFLIDAGRGATMTSEIARWGKIVKDANIKIEQ